MHASEGFGGIEEAAPTTESALVDAPPDPTADQQLVVGDAPSAGHGPALLAIEDLWGTDHVTGRMAGLATAHP